MNILAVIKPAFTVLKQGRSLANPAAWKNAQVIANLLSALVVLLNVLGVHFGLDSDSVNLVAGGIAALANAYLTTATSEKVGVPSDLPPIELVGQSRVAESAGPAVDRRDPAGSRMQRPVRSIDYPVRHNTDEAADHSDFPGWGS